MELELILTSVVAPAGAAAIGGLVVWRPWRGPRDSVDLAAGHPVGLADGVLIGLVLGISYVVGHIWTSGWPPLWPKSASQWLPFCALVGILVAALTERHGTATRVVGRVISSSLVTWLLFGDHFERQPALDAVLWFAIVCASALVCWFAHDRLATRTPGRPLVVTLGIWVAVLGAVFMNCHDAQAAQLAGSVGGALSGLSVLIFLWPDRCPLRSAVPVLALVLTTMLAIQHTDLFGSVPRLASSAMLLALPAAAGLQVAMDIPNRRSGWWTLLPVALFGAAAIWFSWPAEDPYGY